ncbi:MAG: 30S ribosomal protein S3 [Asgard group archaeon]|nr:30S ribosomal protein S3 [Asgard group archaeon]
MSAVNHFIKKGVRQAEIDEFLSKELNKAGYGGVEITKTPLGERIIIHASKPGVVIGRRGKTIRTLTSDLVAKYGFDDPKIDVQEVKEPELNPKVMAYSLVSAIERGVHRRRAAYSALRRIVNAGAKGCEIIIAGKLTSKRSRHEAYRMGLIAKSGEIGSTYVLTANAVAVMKLGAIGVTVSIMRGDVVLPDDITVLSVNLDKKEDEMVVEVAEDKEIAPKEVKVKEEPKEKEKVAEMKPKEPKIAPAAKKTDLDKKVEELSDLIEKTPGEEKKAKPKAPKKDAAAIKKPKPAVKKDEKAKTPAKTTKKEAPKKEVKKEAPKTTKKTTTKKATTTKAATTTKKPTTTKKAPAKKETAKSTTSKKKDEKPSAKKETKATTTKKSTAAKDSKSKKDDKKKKKKKEK